MVVVVEPQEEVQRVKDMQFMPTIRTVATSNMSTMFWNGKEKHLQYKVFILSYMY